jgi:hypothetical protein
VSSVTKELNKLIEGKAERENQWDLHKAINKWENRKERGKDVIG